MNILAVYVYTYTCINAICICIRMCVCVQPCDPRENLFHVVTCLYVSMQGDHPMSAVGGPTKRAALMADMGADHSHVPASWPPEAARLEGCGRFYMSGRHSHVQTCQCCLVE